MPKKTRKSSAGSRKTSSKKRSARSTSKKKTTARKTSAKKTAKRPSTRKKTTRKTSAKKAASKKKTAARKKTARPTKKKAAAPKKKTTASKKAASKKSSAKKHSSKKTTKKAASSKAPAKAADAKQGDPKKPARKGITIVSDRPKRRRSSPKPPTSKFPPTGDRLLGPGSPVRKPLIPSGPSRAAEAAAERAATERSGKKIKSPFTKRELDKFRQILLAKRAELFGDMSTMESGALRSESGGLSHTPQHIAEQGSDSYDQSLSLDLAAADRRLIMEIDDALKRIADKTFGICELTGNPIRKTRLEELPWARYSIEAARELERRSGFRS